MHGTRMLRADIRQTGARLSTGVQWIQLTQKAAFFISISAKAGAASWYMELTKKMKTETAGRSYIRKRQQLLSVLTMRRSAADQLFSFIESQN
jgi:hypothetical protein